MAERYRVAAFSGRDVSELGAYVQRELGRIQQALELASGGATLFRANSTPAAAITLPADASYVKLTEYDQAAPQRDFGRVVPVVADAQIVIRDSGLWGVAAVVNGTGLSSTRDYETRLFLEDTATHAFAVVDLSNQSVQSEFTMIGVARVLATPARLDVRVRQRTAGQTAPFQVAGLYLSVWSVGD